MAGGFFCFTRILETSAACVALPRNPGLEHFCELGPVIIFPHVRPNDFNLTLKHIG
jgi:hypothetical protein